MRNTVLPAYWISAIAPAASMTGSTGRWRAMTNEEAAVYLQFLRHTVPRYGLYDVALIKGIEALTKPVKEKNDKEDKQ